MKINIPLSKADHKAADEKYKNLIERQKAFIHEIADLLQTGQPLNDLQTEIAAAVLRGAANGMKTKRPRSAGKPMKVPPEALLLRAIYIKGGMQAADADRALADQYSVDLDVLKARIKDLKKTEDLSGAVTEGG